VFILYSSSCNGNRGLDFELARILLFLNLLYCYNIFCRDTISNLNPSERARWTSVRLILSHGQKALFITPAFSFFVGI
jgi:hypothetical protein